MEDEVLKNICNLYENSYNFIDKISLSIIECYYIRYKSLEIELEELNNNKPIKIFKKKYSNWIKEKERIYTEKREVLKKIVNEYRELKK